MKKQIFLALALFAVISSVECDSSEDLLEEVKFKHALQYVSTHKDDIKIGIQKLETQCPGVTEKLKQAIKSFKECADKVDDSLTVCQAIQSYTLNCTTPLLKVIDDCVPPKARGLPKFALESLVSVADYLCKQPGESIFELGNPCLWQDAEGEEHEQCAKNLKEISAKVEQSDTIPSKEEICGVLTGVRVCVQSGVTANCQNQKTRNAVIGFFDAAVAPCKQIPLDALTSPDKTLTSITNNFL
ncbi:hypothetical protein Zmor_025286 [Zophobas morio]|uniref:27 kDa hemolymph protein n=1 Tax=Zophobas morio TaxID=2755281 RepID=A0AA38M3Y9_9CUCU|nr:hypothetical protein Zmor_025286 [Zophobas morio]